MEYLVTSDEMRKLDKYTSEALHIPEIVLMERAALGCVPRIKEYINEHNTSKIFFLCGYGNNGGDGLALARLLALDGLCVDVCLVGNEKHATESNHLHQSILEAYSIEIQKYTVEEATQYIQAIESEECILVDALFGIGINRAFSDEYKELIGCINHKGMYIFSLDVPSGLNADNAESGDVICANETFSFGFIKLDTFVYPTRKFCGKVHKIKMGIDEHSIHGKEPGYMMYEDISEFAVPKRLEGAHKGTYKKLLIVAGSDKIYGALYLAAKSAWACGVGMIKVITHVNNKSSLEANLPEVMCSFYDDNTSDEELNNMFDSGQAWADGILIGPGIGLNHTAITLVDLCVNMSDKPLMMDADAIRILGDNLNCYGDINPSGKRKIIITPHLAEFAAMTGESVKNITHNITTIPKAVANILKIAIICKDARSVIASYDHDTSVINASGNDGMASAGSGDVLSGIVSVLMLQMDSAFEAASLGAFIHGLAGTRACSKYGARAMVASNIIDELKDVWN